MIKIKKINKSWGRRIILKDVSCELKSGSSYAVIGKSGIGKTTFLNILGGLESADSGEIFIDGHKMTQKTLPILRRNNFGFVFQNFGLIDTDSIKDNLLIGLANQSLNKVQTEEVMHNVLNNLGLNQLSLNQKVYTLSGGEQQRITLARIILKKPDIIFADEPTGSLDPENAQVILNHLLNDFSIDRTVLIATHDRNVWQRCDYIIQIENQGIKITENMRRI